MGNHPGLQVEDHRESGRAGRHGGRQGLARHRGQTGRATTCAKEKVHAAGTERAPGPAAPAPSFEQSGTPGIIPGSVTDILNLLRDECSHVSAATGDAPGPETPGE